MNYHKITKCDIANGIGIRVSLWISGCTLKCQGCHNPQTWEFNSGKLFTGDTLEELAQALEHPYIDGITLTGGHPLEKQNLPIVYSILCNVKKRLPDKTVWIYTGYLYEQIQRMIYADPNGVMANIISMTDVLVDGRYIEALKDISYPWAGSTNQRVIDVPKTMKEGHVVLWKNTFDET